jgi:hypothetical protein
MRRLVVAWLACAVYGADTGVLIPTRTGVDRAPRDNSLVPMAEGTLR